MCLTYWIALAMAMHTVTSAFIPATCKKWESRVLSPHRSEGDCRWFSEGCIPNDWITERTSRWFMTEQAKWVWNYWSAGCLINFCVAVNDWSKEHGSCISPFISVLHGSWVRRGQRHCMYGSASVCWMAEALPGDAVDCALPSTETFSSFQQVLQG